MRDASFAKAFGKVSNSPNLSVQAAYAFATLAKLFTEEVARSDKLFVELVDKYAAKDESGQLVRHEDRPNSFVIPEANDEAWKKELAEFNSTPVSFKKQLFALNDLKGVGLTPIELMSLDPLIRKQE